MKSGFLFKKKSKSDISGLVYVALYLKDKIELISTGLRVDREDWDSTTGYLYRRRHLKAIDKSLIQIRSEIDHAETRLKARRQVITPKAVKDEYNRHVSDQLTETFEKEKKDKENKKLLIGLVVHWISNNIFQYQASTQRAVRSSLNQFTAFLTKSGNGNANLNDLNLGLITAYEKYLQVDLKLANSSHGKCMKHLRWFLKTVDYDVTSIKLRNNRKEIITLSETELQALENHDVSDNQEHQKVKDLFLLGCYTGLRISDLKRLNETMIIDGKICMTLQKNKREVTIPIVAKTRSILERYGNRSPRVVEQVLNRTIKTICKDAGIQQLLTVRINVAGKDVDRQTPKYKLISSHNASKTFISLAPQWYDLTPAEVAAIVGKDLQTLLNHYYQLPRETAIKKMTSNE